MEKTIDIDVEEHTSDLVKNLHIARREGRLCDVTIKVGSKEVPCHKIVLSEGCDFFKGMFAHRMKENESGVAEMKGVDPECMIMCIEYIYTGKVSIPLQKVLQLLQTAHMLQLTKLCNGIALFLEKRLNLESFFVTRKIASTLSLTRLEETCNKFAMENFPSLAAMDKFKDLEEEYLSFLIRSKETKAEESVKCNALLVWSNSDVDNRTEIFEKNFLSLNFSKMSKEFIDHLAEKEELIFNSVLCLRRLMRTKRDKPKPVPVDVNWKDLFGGLTSLEGGTKDFGVNAIAIFEKRSKTLQALNIEDKRWNVVKDLSNDFAQKSFTAVVVKNVIYVLADDKSNYRLRYTDPSALWVRIPDRTTTRFVSAVGFDGAIYAFDSGEVGSRSIEKFDAATTAWSYVCDKLVRGCGSAVVAAGGFIYCIGGYNANFLNDVTRFEPSRRTWTTMPRMPRGRSGPAAAHLDGKIYVIGGVCDGYLATSQRFDTTTQTWTTLTGLLNSRVCFQICLVQGKIYAVGIAGSENTIEEFDASADKWKIVKKMTVGKIEFRASVALKL